MEKGIFQISLSNDSTIRILNYILLSIVLHFNSIIVIIIIIIIIVVVVVASNPKSKNPLNCAVFVVLC